MVKALEAVQYDDWVVSGGFLRECCVLIFVAERYSPPNSTKWGIDGSVLLMTLTGYLLNGMCPKMDKRNLSEDCVGRVQRRALNSGKREAGDS